ncbi:MAG: hypothetical protein M1524_03375 [Patescibacteria group bacterium]|nr:hypothetical protein [Patescibacteria group bacterium]
MPTTASPERQVIPEYEVNPRSIGIATATFYRNWYPGDVREENKNEKVRGDLALQMISESIGKGFQIAVVDGGSSEAFRHALTDMGITPHAEEEEGMSGSRRQAFKEVSKLDGVKVIAWAEPEKVSIVRDCLPEAALPILQGTADIVVPRRDAAAFSTYPDYQVMYEQRANNLWNTMLRNHNLLPESAEDLDVWFGPRLFKNEPGILNIFLTKYEFNKRETAFDKIINPELWPNALFLPVARALYRGLRVRSIPVNYRHPNVQTAIEKDSDEFRRKRDIQYKDIIVCTIHLIRALEDHSRSRLYTTI